jgi:hypothetical protein
MRAERSKRLVRMIPLVIVGITLFVFLGGTAVRLLWNWLLPPLFGFPAVTFWQALGLLALGRILFGGFGMHGSGRRYSRGRWEHLTPEERERLRARWGCEPRPESADSR